MRQPEAKEVVTKLLHVNVRQCLARAPTLNSGESESGNRSDCLHPTTCTRSNISKYVKLDKGLATKALPRLVQLSLLTSEKAAKENLCVETMGWDCLSCVDVLQ